MEFHGAVTLSSLARGFFFAFPQQTGAGSFLLFQPFGLRKRLTPPSVPGSRSSARPPSARARCQGCRSRAVLITAIAATVIGVIILWMFRTVSVSHRMSKYTMKLTATLEESRKVKLESRSANRSLSPSGRQLILFSLGICIHDRGTSTARKSPQLGTVFVHIAAIVIGLIIAVSLEQTVEFFHHRHQREELEAALQRDGRTNREYLKDDITKAQGIFDWALEQSSALERAGADRSAGSTTHSSWIHRLP